MSVSTNVMALVAPASAVPMSPWPMWPASSSASTEDARDQEIANEIFDGRQNIMTAAARELPLCEPVQSELGEAMSA